MEAIFRQGGETVEVKSRRHKDGGMDKVNNKKLVRELEIIMYYIREYGINIARIDVNSEFWDSNVKRDFFIKVHEGFYNAQERALSILTKILKERKRLREELKVARRNKEKTKTSQLMRAIKNTKYQECVVRKTMDTIVWTIFQLEPSTVRRLYCNEEPIDITDSNIKSEINFVDDYKKNEPDGFALICDMTSFVQIGDIITVRYGEGIKIYELKEGVVNEKIFNLFQNVQKNHCSAYLSYELRQESPKFREQFQRDINQMEKSMNVVQTINTGNGIDPGTGASVRILEGNSCPLNFTTIIQELNNKCNVKGYAISVVQNCVFVGVYDPDRLPPTAFEVWIKMMRLETIMCDLRQTFFDPLAYPVYLHPFSETFISEIIIGKKVVKIAVSFDKLFPILENMGCSVRILSRKESNRFRGKSKANRQAIELDGRMIEIKREGVSIILGKGYLSKIFSMFLTPLSICEEITETLTAMKDIKQND